MNNKGFLIDTQIFIWWMEKSKRLSKKSFDLLNDPQNKIFLSVASVEVFHVLGVEKLPYYHKDPFDRILISQAQVENLAFITSDEKIWKYNVAVVRC